MSSAKPVTILLVEDDLGHARLIEKNLRRAGLSNEIIHLDNGLDAVDFIFGEGTWQGRPSPSPILVLLDLNMPEMDGLQVLQRLKGDPRTHRIPVIILTTTDDQGEIGRCYDLGCNLYITKPIEYEQFAGAIRDLGLFLSVVALPNGV